MFSRSFNIQLQFKLLAPKKIVEVAWLFQFLFLPQIFKIAFRDKTATDGEST